MAWVEVLAGVAMGRWAPSVILPEPLRSFRMCCGWTFVVQDRRARGAEGHQRQLDDPPPPPEGQGGIRVAALVVVLLAFLSLWHFSAG